jgi:hypothetical protein
MVTTSTTAISKAVPELLRLALSPAAVQLASLKAGDI